MRLVIVAGLLALAGASPALADWQGTTWGMTPDQVMAATGAIPATGEPLNKGEALRAAGEYEAAGFSFRSRFYFAAGHLRVVSLELRETTRCGELLGALTAIYGEPMLRRDRAARWASPADNFYVLLNEPWPPHSETCRVFYEPISRTSASGL